MNDLDRGPAPVKEEFDPVKWTRIFWLAIIGLLAAVILGLLAWFFIVFSFIDLKDKGVSMFFPRGWRVETQAPGIVVAFVSPKETALDSFSENVVLSTYDMSNNPLNTDKYVDLMIKQMEGVFSNIKLVDRKFFLAAGRNGYQLEFHVADDVPKVILVYAFTVEATGYNLVYMGVKDRYSKDKLLMDIMALFMKVKD
ncbi:MAG: hypothetical protein WCI27_10100 [Candidatus Omnitrophota bacterium]